MPAQWEEEFCWDQEDLNINSKVTFNCLTSLKLYINRSHSLVLEF